MLVNNVRGDAEEHVRAQVTKKKKKERVRGEMCEKYVSGDVRRAYVVRVMREETPRSMCEHRSQEHDRGDVRRDVREA